MADSDIQVEYDAEELLRRLEVLKDIIDKKEVVTAERSAAKLLMSRGYDRLVDTLKGNSDYLVESFTYNLRKGKFAGIRVGFRRPGGNVAHLVDLGTKERQTKSGANRGKIQGSKFWTDTKARYVPEATEMIMTAIDDAIRKITTRT